MRIYRGSKFSIIFGDNETSVDPNDRHFFQTYTAQTILSEYPFVTLKETLNITHLVKSKQVHGIDGVAFTSFEHVPSPYSLEGDYLITRLPAIGLAVDTADCIPLILYDNENHIVCIVHAGWRGIAQNIVQKSIDHLKSIARTQPEDLSIFVGPSAGVCCYEFEGDALSHFSSLNYFNKIIAHVRGKVHIDLIACIYEQLKEAGVSAAAINLNFHVCTICNTQFPSYRRDKNFSRRMLTVVALKE